MSESAFADGPHKICIQNLAVLQAENTALKAEAEKSLDSYLELSKMLREAAMKNKSLWEQSNLWKAENGRLKDALENVMNTLGMPEAHYPYPVANAYDIARNALSPNPTTEKETK